MKTKYLKLLAILITVIFIITGLSCKVGNNDSTISNEIKEEDLGDNMASGSLSAGTVTTTTINVNFAFTGCTLSVYLYRGSLLIAEWSPGHSSDSGSFTKTGLTPNTNYTWTLKHGSTTLATKTIKTLATAPPLPPPPSGSGAISKGAVTSSSINVNYAFSNCGSVGLYRGGSLVKNCGSGSGSGAYTSSGLNPGTNYSFYLKDGGTTLASATYGTLTEGGEEPPTPPYVPPPDVPPPDLPPPPPTTSGALSAAAISPTAVDLNWSYSYGSSVSLFRDSTLVITFGSGANSGVYHDIELAPNTVFVYTLRNGATIGSTLLASATVGTPQLPAEGTLTGQIIDSLTIDLTYSFSYGTNVSLFRDSAKVTTLGSGSGSGTYRDGSLTPDTSYTYTLRNGSLITDTLLATATTKTLKEARQFIIARGKILPLSSEITIFDSTLKRLGLLEDYEYTYWNFKYRSVGNFKLIINRYKSNTEYLVKGNILALYVAGYYRAGIIEYKEIQLDEEGKKSENYTITGRLLGGLLSERIALHVTASGTGYDSQNTIASTAMRHYVNVNCMDAVDPDRNYPLLYLEDPDPECGGTIKYDARFQTIAELCEEICLASSLGWEIVLDPTSKKFVFMNIEGVDRSFGNGVNSPVTFSPKFGNIRLINYIDSSINSKNVAYVAGQGDANARDVDKVTYLSRAYTNDPAAGNNIELNMVDTSIFTVDDVVMVSSSAGSELATITVVHANTHITVNTLALNHTTTNPLVSTSYTGMARREFLIDARDLDTTDKMLQRGNERLVELGETKVIESENLAAGPFSFGEDFYLGDIVTVAYPDIVTADVRVIESIIEIDSKNLIQNRLIFGKQYPDLINIRNKDFLPEIRR